MDAIQKAARVEKQALAGEELALINRQALKELTEEEVFVFRVAACDNQVDREQERFTEAALDRLAELYVGKTVIMDHRWSANGQTARIYAGAVEESEGVRRLVLRAYMLRNDQTAPLIAAIEGGILREVSVAARWQRPSAPSAAQTGGRPTAAIVPARSMRASGATSTWTPPQTPMSCPLWRYRPRKGPG